MYGWKNFALVLGWHKRTFLPELMIFGIGSNVFCLETTQNYGPRLI